MTSINSYMIWISNSSSGRRLYYITITKGGGERNIKESGSLHASQAFKCQRKKRKENIEFQEKERNERGIWKHRWKEARIDIRKGETSRNKLQ